MLLRLTEGLLGRLVLFILAGWVALEVIHPRLAFIILSFTFRVGLGGKMPCEACLINLMLVWLRIGLIL